MNELEKKLIYVTEKSLFHDLNVDLLVDCTKHFEDTMYYLGLYPLIVRPTRITSHSATLIDNIYTSQINNILNSGLIIDDISDHLPNFTLYDLNNLPISEQPQFGYSRKCNDTIKQHLIEKLNNIDWNCVLKNKTVDTAIDIFKCLYAYY